MRVAAVAVGLLLLLLLLLLLTLLLLLLLTLLLLTLLLLMLLLLLLLILLLLLTARGEEGSGLRSIGVVGRRIRPTGGEAGTLDSWLGGYDTLCPRLICLTASIFGSEGLLGVIWD